MDDIAINKAEVIRRCLARIAEEYRGDASRLRNFTTQDSVILNLLRACEASIDLAMHRIAAGRLGIPQNSRDAFDILASAKLISCACAESLKNMVGFRNIAVHDDQRIQLEILTAILTDHLTDFESYLQELGLWTHSSE
jgi:uncharacterized protein YutE (UPF0331/DUF86 family)